jgi:hypothetical protein
MPRHLRLGHLRVEQRLEHGGAVGRLLNQCEHDALGCVPFDIRREAFVQYLAGRDICHPPILFGPFPRRCDAEFGRSYADWMAAWARSESTLTTSLVSEL